MRRVAGEVRGEHLPGRVGQGELPEQEVSKAISQGRERGRRALVPKTWNSVERHRCGRGREHGMREAGGVEIKGLEGPLVEEFGFPPEDGECGGGGRGASEGRVK